MSRQYLVHDSHNRRKNTEELFDKLDKLSFDGLGIFEYDHRSPDSKGFHQKGPTSLKRDWQDLSKENRLGHHSTNMSFDNSEAYMVNDGSTSRHAKLQGLGIFNFIPQNQGQRTLYMDDHVSGIDKDLTLDEEEYDLYSELLSVTQNTSLSSLIFHDTKKFETEYKIFKNSYDNNKSMLECMEDMLVQENQHIVDEMMRVINDISNSVAQNTIRIRGDYFLCHRK